MGYTEFQNQFLNQLAQYENTKFKIGLFKRALDKAVDNELPLRDCEHSFQIRDICHSANLRISYNSTNLMCKYSEEKTSLLVGTLAPAWSRGWRTISQDPYVSELIGDLFFFMNQYVYRGYQVNLLGAIALTYGRPCDFRGNEFSDYVLPFCIEKYNSFRNNIPILESRRNHIFTYYVELINSLDPYVNRVIHYYIRALSLLKDGYDEEAITAADNAIDIIIQAIKLNRHMPTKSRSDMYGIMREDINLPSGTLDQLENLYLIRCRFSAHPAQTKWWDFSEIYDCDIEKIMYAVKSTIVRFLQYEEKNRKIEKYPLCWSKWFVDNCDKVFDAVWFHRLPILR